MAAPAIFATIRTTSLKQDIFRKRIPCTVVEGVDLIDIIAASAYERCALQSVAVTV